MQSLTEQYHFIPNKSTAKIASQKPANSCVMTIYRKIFLNIKTEIERCVCFDVGKAASPTFPLKSMPVLNEMFIFCWVLQPNLHQDPEFNQR